MNTFSMIAAILVSSLIVTTNAYCGEGANSAGDENWTLVDGADADMLFFGRAVESAQRSFGSLIVTSGRLSLPRTSMIGEIAGTNIIAQLSQIIPNQPVRIAAGRSGHAHRTLVVLEQQVGSSAFYMGWVSDENMTTTSTPSMRGGVGWEAQKWPCITSVALATNSLVVLTHPTVAELGEAMFVAGEGSCLYKVDLLAIWVASEKNLEENNLLGVMLGEGHSPCLVRWNNKLICMAIRPLQWRPLTASDDPGRLVAWISEDGKNWTEWDTGIVEQDMVRIRARSWENDEVALVGQTPTETCLYEMRNTEQKFQKTAIVAPREGVSAGSPRMLTKDGGGVRVLSRDAKTPGRILTLERRPTGAE